MICRRTFLERPMASAARAIPIHPNPDGPDGSRAEVRQALLRGSNCAGRTAAARVAVTHVSTTQRVRYPGSLDLFLLRKRQRRLDRRRSEKLCGRASTPLPVLRNRVVCTSTSGGHLTSTDGRARARELAGANVRAGEDHGAAAGRAVRRARGLHKKQEGGAVAGAARPLDDAAGVRGVPGRGQGGVRAAQGWCRPHRAQRRANRGGESLPAVASLAPSRLVSLRSHFSHARLLSASPISPSQSLVEPLLNAAPLSTRSRAVCVIIIHRRWWRACTAAAGSCTAPPPSAC